MFLPRLLDLLPQLICLPLAIFQEEPAEQAPAGMFDTMLVPFALIFVIFYFLMIRPEKKNRQKRESMLAELKKGAKVITSGGLYGTVIQIKDEVVTLQIAEGVRVRYSLQAIQGLAKDGETKTDKEK